MTVAAFAAFWGKIQTMETIATMTLEDLRKFVEDMLEKRLQRLLITLGAEAERTDSGLSWEQVRDLAERHRWTPPAGAAPSLELLREDRER